jgi:competence protein ComEC
VDESDRWRPGNSQSHQLRPGAGVGSQTIFAGEHFSFGRAEAQVLAPDPAWTGSAQAQNDDSLVLKLTYAGHAVLLEGDAGKKVERLVARSDATADVLKVGHHGGVSSTAPELLAAVRPRFAVVSVGKGNHFGLPKPQVLQRLQANGVATFRTDTEGAVTFLIDEHGVRATLPNRR